MKLKTLFLSTSSICLGIIPISFSISCSSSSSNDSGTIPETGELQKLLDNISPKSSKPTVIGLIEKTSNNWTNKDDLNNQLSQYFDITNFQISDNIYNKIVKYVIQPSPDSTDLSIIFYLVNYYDNFNVAQKTISDANSSNGYPNQMKFVKSTPFDSAEQFNAIWDKINNDFSAIQDLITKAFGFSLPNDINDKNTFDEYFDLSKNAFSINLSIKDKGKQEGYIFQKGNSYGYCITSEPLVLSPETIELQNLLNNISPKSSKPTVIGLIEKTSNNWTNKKNLCEQLSQYFDITNFQKSLSDNVYNKIVKYVIQPSPDSTDLSIIFYLNGNSNDVAQKTISNANSLNGYPNKMEFVNSTPFDSTDQFNAIWDKIKNNDFSAIQDLITKAFGFSLPNNINDKKTFDEYFYLSKKGYSINLSIKDKGKQEGYIFKKDNSYDYFIYSESLVLPTNNNI